MFGRFIKELNRRNVFRVAAIYFVVSWLLMQIGDVMFDALLLPEWTTTMLAAFLILGLPVALIFAWAYEITPDGVLRTEDVPEEHSITSQTGQKINYLIIAGLAAAVCVLLLRDFYGDDPEQPFEEVVNASGDSIAVLPFKNQSASAEQNAEFFAGGVHDEILTLLSKIGDMRVISRTSVERLDPDLSIPEIGKLLGVATVLEGQVQRAGNRLRINVQLIDTLNEGHLWANTYDRELTAQNIFDVQSDIARTISGALHAELKPEDEALLTAVPTTNTEAFENYLLGVQRAKTFSYQAFRDAEVFLTRAIKLDPNYAEAWAELAYIYSQSAQTGLISKSEYIELAEPAVRQALTLNPRSPVAYAQQGFLYAALGDDGAAEQSFKQAIELDPNDTRTLELYGFYLRNVFRAPEAIPVLEAALALDPLSTEIIFQLGKAEMHSGMPEKLIERAERIREIDPTVVNGYTAMLQAHLWSGNLGEGIPWFMKAIEFDELDYENWAHMALHMDQLGFQDAADRYMQRAEELGPGEPSVLKCKAAILFQRGDQAGALRVARKGLDDQLDFRWGSELMFLDIVTTMSIESGNPDLALDYHRDIAPELFDAQPTVTVDNMFYVPHSALLLKETGNDALADQLLRLAYDEYERVNPNHLHGYDFSILDVELLAMLGEDDLALAYFRQAVEEGWGLGWADTLNNLTLDSIRGRDEFQESMAMISARRDDQSEQLANRPDMGKFDFRTKKGPGPRTGSDPI